jgi:hypothetical protein
MFGIRIRPNCPAFQRRRNGAQDHCCSGVYKITRTVNGKPYYCSSAIRSNPMLGEN